MTQQQESTASSHMMYSCIASSDDLPFNLFHASHLQQQAASDHRAGAQHAAAAASATLRKSKPAAGMHSMYAS